MKLTLINSLQEPAAVEPRSGHVGEFFSEPTAAPRARPGASSDSGPIAAPRARPVTSSDSGPFAGRGSNPECRMCMHCDPHADTMLRRFALDIARALLVLAIYVCIRAADKWFDA